MSIATHGRVPTDTLAHRLILLRSEMRLSQREAALLCGVTYGEWQSMESGREARGLDSKVAKIADATGYSRDWIMWGGPLVAPQPDPSPPGKQPRGRVVPARSSELGLLFHPMGAESNHTVAA